MKKRPERDSKGERKPVVDTGVMGIMASRWLKRKWRNDIEQRQQQVLREKIKNAAVAVSRQKRAVLDSDNTYELHVVVVVDLWWRLYNSDGGSGSLIARERGRKRKENLECW
ncbi:hypothetical protein PIB30_045100 [Stylosanthes scabra]|uniref:Uncharacterized protein n=1 Tax=Stylosanthes scabra TaxID=79078 RepID=A0ABU6ZET7_9FABA|nr:hypothetical protein [Stylosanthes scabra]